jgi:hypothetical protein
MIPMSDRDKIHLEFDFDDLLLPDMKTRVETATKAIAGALATPDEERANFGRPPKPGGNKLYLNGSLQPAGQQTPQGQPLVLTDDEPQPKQPKEGEDDDDE